MKTLKTLFTRFKEDGLYYIPFGGTEEIGMNLNAFCSRINGQEEWIILDIGTGMLGEMGIQTVIPEFKDLVTKDIRAIILTHAHEDHIGALPFILPKLKNKPAIYCTYFTQQMVKRKLQEYKIEANFNVVPVDGDFFVGDFEFRFAYVTHSIPEPNMIFMKSKHFKRTILHTGDWKFDNEPMLGSLTNKKRIAQFGKEGIDFLMIDSTNSPREERTNSEGEVKEALEKIIRSLHGKRVIVSCFASNVARLSSLIKIAKGVNRKLLLLGRSMEAIFKIAEEAGLLPQKDMRHVISINQASEIDNADLLIVCTGSQGEKGSVLSKLAEEGDFHPIKLQDGDYVIFSSRVIPGNEKSIGQMKNALLNRKVKVIDERKVLNEQYGKIHASGHPSATEIRELLDLVKPSPNKVQWVIPVHGDRWHLESVKEVCNSIGIETVLIPKNGVIINLTSQVPCIIGELEVGIMGVDGKQLVNLKSPMLETRKQIGEHGLLALVVRRDRKEVASFLNYGCLPAAFINDTFTAIVNSIIGKNLGIEPLPKIEGAIQTYISGRNKKKPLVQIILFGDEQEERLNVRKHIDRRKKEN